MKILQNTNKIFLILPKPVDLIHKALVVESYSKTREIWNHNGPGWHRREIQFIFTWAARLFTYWKYTDEASHIVSDEDIMEKKLHFCYVMEFKSH